MGALTAERAFSPRTPPRPLGFEHPYRYNDVRDSPFGKSLTSSVHRQGLDSCYTATLLTRPLRASLALVQIESPTGASSC